MLKYPIKQIVIVVLFLAKTTGIFSQDLPCSYKIEKTGEGKYKIQVKNFDSLQAGETCFLSWMNTGKGKPDGELLVYDEAGRKRRLAVYKSGIRVGTHYDWYKTGEIHCATNWETDLYFNSKCFYPSGKIEGTAVNSNRDNAVYTSYYESGQIKSVTTSSPDSEKNYYENGQVKSDKSAVVYMEWYRDGKIKVTGSLEGGFTRTGKWSCYDDKGKLVRELFYEKNTTSWYGDERGFKTEKKY